MSKEFMFFNTEMFYYLIVKKEVEKIIVESNLPVDFSDAIFEFQNSLSNISDADFNKKYLKEKIDEFFFNDYRVDENYIELVKNFIDNVDRLKINFVEDFCVFANGQYDHVKKSLTNILNVLNEISEKDLKS